MWSYSNSIFIGPWLVVLAIEREHKFRIGFDFYIKEGFCLSFSIPFFYIYIFCENEALEDEN